jgi:hypothetical protein
MCKDRNMPTAKDRNLTIRLPIALLRRLKAESAAEGVSMNAYLERLLASVLDGGQNDAQQKAAKRLLERAKSGLYEIDKPLSRDEAHNRRV